MRYTQQPGYAGGSDNVLKTVNQGTDAWSHSTTLRATTVLSSTFVNALHVAINTGDLDNYPDAVLLAQGHRVQRLQLIRVSQEGFYKAYLSTKKPASEEAGRTL